jgi:hypothetical protein
MNLVARQEWFGHGLSKVNQAQALLAAIPQEIPRLHVQMKEAYPLV